jgi:Ni/Co efflux regulator RcnB
LYLRQLSANFDVRAEQLAVAAQHRHPLRNLSYAGAHMTRIRKVLALSALAATLSVSGGFAIAQDHHDDGHHDDGHDSHYVRHDEWKKGGKINHDDWNRGQQVDYHQYHLNAPPRGYEWRSVDGNYVLAAAATGVIASVVVASAIH